jgi:F420H(2)-dependent quinone reductase
MVIQAHPRWPKRSARASTRSSPASSTPGDRLWNERAMRIHDETQNAETGTGRIRVAALLLTAGLLAGPVGTHVYWALGGTWGLHQSTSTGIRVVAVLVTVMLVAAVLVVLARVGLWQPAFVSDRVIRFFAWALAGVFLVETLAAFTWSRGEPEWWLYGPVSLVIALLALVVAGSGGASRVGGTRAGIWVIGNLISPVQRWVIRKTGGRVTLTRKPMLLLTAIGRRSGRSRTVPLLYLRDGDNLIVCNVRPPGERRNPWPLNVRANPEVSISIGGVAEPRIARDARPEELKRFWPRLVTLWPPYERLFAQTHERSIFVLELPASKHAVSRARVNTTAAVGLRQ